MLLWLHDQNHYLGTYEIRNVSRIQTDTPNAYWSLTRSGHDRIPDTVYLV